MVEQQVRASRALQLPLWSQLGAGSCINVSVNPTVLLSVIDHYTRRQEDQDRVIGTLLGVRGEDGNHIEVRNCFPVPHSEMEDQVRITRD